MNDLIFWIIIIWSLIGVFIFFFYTEKNLNEKTHTLKLIAISVLHGVIITAMIGLYLLERKE